nr:protein YIPF1 homolog [Ipomoea batatas]
MMSSNYTAIDNQNVSGSVPAVADPSPQVSVKFTESNLQTFPPSTSQGKISRSSGPPRDADGFKLLRLSLGLWIDYVLSIEDNLDAVVVVIGTWAFDDKMVTFILALNELENLEKYSACCKACVTKLCHFDLWESKGKFLFYTFSKPVSGSEDPQQQQQASGWLSVFTIAAYKPYFDVDTSDVLERIKDSLFPFSGAFTEKTSSSPDLYGPFWICTTLIFVAASIGTFVTYLSHKLQNKEWDYDINLLTWSAGLFYGYVLIVPLCLYVILKYFSAPAGIVQLFCLYGYSLFIFIPALCLSVVPFEIFRWVIAGVAGFMSATFVALNLKTHITSSGERWFLIVVGIFLLQLALALVLKLYLFTVTV